MLGPRLNKIDRQCNISSIFGLFLLDYNQFNAYWENAPDFDENRLSVTFGGFDNPNYLLAI